ncbi:unnamed protein product [Somion occarium]|uniref:Amino acid permease/ SLC12A domain-containing protein n=1 Tax=Somion occarium TaxID=3059160 RepID=A0ABP1E1H7_9APHY
MSQTLRERTTRSSGSGHVQIVAPPGGTLRFEEQRRHIAELQELWRHIKVDLPPQLSRRHIGMISIGGVIGTGLFLGSASALHNGGPLGALLGYVVVGSVVFGLCVSIGEMIAFLPNVGGPVGLADLYVDPALGFSLGWASWYNWTAEISAATVVVGFWTKAIPPWILTALFLFMATVVNCFPSHVYGELEFWFSTIKVLTIVIMIIVSLVLDIVPGQDGRSLGFSNWQEPFAQYLSLDGAKGRFLGFISVLMQAAFSFSGSEVPGIAAGEVIDATRNVPRALCRVWIRI